jgi:ABC-2 type transport system permease protein
MSEAIGTSRLKRKVRGGTGSLLAYEPIQGPSVHQHWIFQRLRFRLLQNGIRVALRQSSVRIVSIFLCSLVVWGAIYAGSAYGFYLFQLEHVDLLGAIVGLVFDLLFLSLTMLLIFSSGIILYGSLFSSPESTFLLSTPAAADQIFANKFQSAIAFSSWAFVLLGSPVLIAYGITAGAPWYFYIILPLFFFGFVLLPGSLGALACLLVANWTPRRPRQLLAAVAIVVVCGVAYWGYQFARAALSESIGRDWLPRLLDQLAFTQGSLLPSHWMARGLQHAARRNLRDTLYYLGLIWSNGLFLFVLTAAAASQLYRRGYNLVATGGSLRRRYRGRWLDRFVSSMVGFLDPQTRLLIIKDFRTFRRDPVQWAQVLIFTGLLTLYFFNTRRFYHEELGRAYQNSVSLLNLTAIGLLLCSYTGRFIFPMISLEGRKFWILGLLPLPRERLLWGEFAFSALGGWLIAESLIVLSDLLLHVPWYIIGLHALTVTVIATGLSGLSVGLGACMPNFRESDPSKIAVGFGGTLNLVTGLLFLLATIALMAMPYHLMGILSQAVFVSEFWRMVIIAAGIVGGFAFGIIAAVFPMRMGIRALSRMEF